MWYRFSAVSDSSDFLDGVMDGSNFPSVGQGLQQELPTLRGVEWGCPFNTIPPASMLRGVCIPQWFLVLLVVLASLSGSRLPLQNAA
jgi:hypothetical protein